MCQKRDLSIRFLSEPLRLFSSTWIELTWATHGGLSRAYTKRATVYLSLPLSFTLQTRLQYIRLLQMIAFFPRFATLKHATRPFSVYWKITLKKTFSHHLIILWPLFGKTLDRFHLRQYLSHVLGSAHEHPIPVSATICLNGFVGTLASVHTSSKNYKQWDRIHKEMILASLFENVSENICMANVESALHLFCFGFALEDFFSFKYFISSKSYFKKCVERLNVTCTKRPIGFCMKSTALLAFIRARTFGDLSI